MSAHRARSVCLSVLAGVLAVLGSLVVSAGPAAASVDPPQLTLLNGPDNRPLSGAPFVGEDFFAETDNAYFVGNPQSTDWTCSVDFGDGTPPDGYWRSRFNPAPCAMYHAYADPGTYTITLTVTDPDGESAQATRTVTVGDRPVYHHAGGVEGSVVRLSAKGSPSSVYWSTTSFRDCVISDPTALRPSVQCDDEGTYVFTFDGDSNASSGEYVVSFVNGAPAPVVEPQRVGPAPDFEAMPAPRVGTGDAVQWYVDAHDPSFAIKEADPGTSYAHGDDLTCVFTYDDGTTETYDASYLDGCYGQHTYLAAGTHTVTVTVTDDSGAAATATGSVGVVRRDVKVSSHGHQSDGLRGRAVGTLTPAGVDGRMHFVTPAGREVVVTHLTDLEVSAGQTVLTGPATVDGRSKGWSVYVEIYRKGPVAMLVDLDHQSGGTTTSVEYVEASRKSFTNVYHVPWIG